MKININEVEYPAGYVIDEDGTELPRTRVVKTINLEIHEIDVLWLLALMLMVLVKLHWSI